MSGVLGESGEEGESEPLSVLEKISSVLGSSSKTDSSGMIPPLYELDPVRESESSNWSVDNVFYTCDRSVALSSGVSGIATPGNLSYYDDWITAASFSNDGQHIGIGDRMGRIWIYSTALGKDRLNPTAKVESAEDSGWHGSSSAVGLSSSSFEYEFYGQFQSHQKVFDKLKSMDIPPSINCVEWSRTSMNYLTLLAANDKTVKLWKVFEKGLLNDEREHSAVASAAAAEYSSGGAKGSSSSSVASSWPKDLTDSRLGSMITRDAVHIPAMSIREVITAAISRRVFSDGHKYHIHSLSVSPDCETFITADDFRINMWSFDHPSTRYCLCDKLNDLKGDLQLTYESITSAFLHSRHPLMLGYTTSNHNAVICDLRMKSRIEADSEISEFSAQSSHAMRVGECMVIRDALRMQNDAYNRRRTFFSDCCTGIRNGEFATVGGLEYLIMRDYFNAYCFDLRRSDLPLRRLPLIPYSEEICAKMFSNDHLFDTQLTVSHCRGIGAGYSLCAAGINNDLVVYDDWHNASDISEPTSVEKVELTDPSSKGMFSDESSSSSALLSKSHRRSDLSAARSKQSTDSEPGWMDAKKFGSSLLIEPDCYTSAKPVWHPLKADVMAAFHKTALFMLSRNKVT